MGDMSWGGAMDSQIEEIVELKAENSRLRFRNEALEKALGELMKLLDRVRPDPDTLTTSLNNELAYAIRNAAAALDGRGK
jgi:hypothetical protein